MTAGKPQLQAPALPLRQRPSPPSHKTGTASRFYEHSSANRINTEAVIADAVRAEYPQLHLTVVPQFNCNLLGYAAAGHAGLAPIDKEQDRLNWRLYLPPAKRLYGSGGLADDIKLGKYLLDWKGKEYIIYVVSVFAWALALRELTGSCTGRRTRRHLKLQRHHATIRPLTLADGNEPASSRSRKVEQ